MTNIAALKEWQQAHSRLLEEERALAKLAVRLARGEIFQPEMDAALAEVRRMRARTDDLFRAASRLGG